MAYNEQLLNRIRESLMHLPNVSEKYMFGGVCFMVDDKMCVGIAGDELMCRIDPEKEEEAMSQKGARPMDFTGRIMKGYVFVAMDAIQQNKDFEYWINLCLAYNPKAKKSKKKS